jgi:hypothetical protein
MGWTFEQQVLALLGEVLDRLAALEARGQPRPVPPPRRPCVHRGPPLGDTVRCVSCRGTRLNVYGCAVHGKCTLTRKGDGVACCEDAGRLCPDYANVLPADPTSH